MIILPNYVGIIIDQYKDPYFFKSLNFGAFAESVISVSLRFDSDELSNSAAKQGIAWELPYRHLPLVISTLPQMARKFSFSW